MDKEQTDKRVCYFRVQRPSVEKGRLHRPEALPYQSVYTERNMRASQNMKGYSWHEPKYYLVAVSFIPRQFNHNLSKIDAVVIYRTATSTMSFGQLPLIRRSLLDTSLRESN